MDATQTRRRGKVPAASEGAREDRGGSWEGSVARHTRRFLVSFHKWRDGNDNVGFLWRPPPGPRLTGQPGLAALAPQTDHDTIDRPRTGAPARGATIWAGRAVPCNSHPPPRFVLRPVNRGGGAGRAGANHRPDPVFMITRAEILRPTCRGMRARVGRVAGVAATFA